MNTEGSVSIPVSAMKNPVIKEGKEMVFQDDAFIGKVHGAISGKRDNDYITFGVSLGSYSFCIGESF